MYNVKLVSEFFYRALMLRSVAFLHVTCIQTLHLIFLTYLIPLDFICSAFVTLALRCMSVSVSYDESERINQSESLYLCTCLAWF